MSDDIKKGLLGIVVDETTISQVMPEISSLTYRGYAVQDLCEMCRFEEAAYLILNGDLPNSIQLKKFEKEEKSNRDLSKKIIYTDDRSEKKIIIEKGKQLLESHADLKNDYKLAYNLLHDVTLF